MKMKYFMILGVLLLTIAVQGCNTVRGVGKDVQSAADHND
jgi:predicted small secreted protein